MRRRCLIFYLLCMLYATAIAQKTTGDTSVPVFFEKAYLHTDRNTYAQGEDLWFKAYVVNAQNNKAIDYSKNLYVELISPAAKIIQRKMLRIENGLTNGDFKLPDTLAGGNYRLRAYTNWMRNFGDNFIFEKDIHLISAKSTAPGMADVASSNKKMVKKAAVIKKVTLDTLPIVRFFPEGGDMVIGVNSLIAVKSEDAYGHGIASTGNVVDNNGSVTAHFVCDSLGFGSFYLSPVLGQHYQANATIRSVSHKFILPEPKPHGLAISVINGNPLIRIVLSWNSDDLSSQLGNTYNAIIKHSGKTLITKTIKIQGKANLIVVTNDILPEGIAAITINDAANTSVAERLVYINHSKSNLLAVSSDKGAYHQNEQATINIKLANHSPANLSIAVVDANVSPVPVENILSYLNLRSEIKGNVEQATRYFDTTNVNRIKQMDLLLLTQGWRDFIWKKLENAPLNIIYQPERDITVTGKVRSVWTKKTLAGANVTMHLPQAEGTRLFWAETDTVGRFIKKGVKFYGYQYPNFTVRSSTKINSEGRAKGNKNGWIQVDSLYRDVLKVDPVPYRPDALRNQPDELAEINALRRMLNLKASHNLKEVVIRDRRTQEPSEPPQVYPITIAEQREYDNLAQYVLYHAAVSLAYESCACGLPGASSRGLRGGYIYAAYADGTKIDHCYCQEDLMSLSMKDVLRVKITRYGSFSAIDVKLRPGVLENDYFDNTTADMVGYTKARVFYKPNPGSTNDKPDPRVNTIHWEPNITTDAKGEATVSYYNTPLTGKMRVIVQGITQNGEPVYQTVKYEVK